MHALVAYLSLSNSLLGSRDARLAILDVLKVTGAVGGADVGMGGMYLLCRVR